MLEIISYVLQLAIAIVIYLTYRNGISTHKLINSRLSQMMRVDGENKFQEGREAGRSEKSR